MQLFKRLKYFTWRLFLSILNGRKGGNVFQNSFPVHNGILNFKIKID